MTKKQLEKLLIIAFSAGYEIGHHDTVEGNFWGNGRTETHDNLGKDWFNEAKKDDTFDRELNL